MFVCWKQRCKNDSLLQMVAHQVRQCNDQYNQVCASLEKTLRAHLSLLIILWYGISEMTISFYFNTCYFS